MNENELTRLSELFTKLNKLLKLYGGKYYIIQIRIIDDIVDCINSNLTSDKKTEYIIRNYKNLYPPHGGLSDFYIQHDNYEERLKLNKPLDEINDNLWNIMKKYI